MRQKLEGDPSSASPSGENERFWALCWYQSWRNALNGSGDRAHERAHDQAKLHLMAYLQEPCYWVAQDVHRKLSRRAVVSSVDRVSDYFQMAIAEVTLPLKRFNPERSNNLKGFARMVLHGCLIDILRRRDAVDSCTPWGLLRKSTKKTIQAALTQEGLNAPQIERSMFLWMVFNTTYAPTQPGAGGKLPPPTSEQWEAIAAFYNSKRTGQLTQPGSSLSPDAVEESLGRLAASIQNYLQPTLLSTDVFISSDDTESPRFGDLLVKEGSPASLLDDLIAKENLETRARDQSAIEQMLINDFNQLGEKYRTVLCALYCQGLSQEQTAERIGKSQSTVSKSCKHAKKHFLQSILAWREDQLNHFPNPDQLKDIEVTLNLWLMDTLPTLGLCDPLDD